MGQNYGKKSELPDRLPPQNLEAECSLLGSLMLNKNSIIKVADFLEEKDFYKNIHQDIYSVIRELFEKGEPVDLLSVAARLKEQGKLEEVGGNAYLAELVNSVPNALHAQSYAKIVQRKRVLRELINASYEIGTLGYDENEETQSLLDRAEQRIFQIAQKGLNQAFVSVKDSLESAFERIEMLSKRDRVTRGLSSGYKDLDNILSGFQNSDLIILASRPGIGKSTLAMDLAKNITYIEKTPVAVFSLEMSTDQLVDRLIASQANVDLWRLRTGKLSMVEEENDFTKIQHAMGVLAECPIYVCDQSSLSVLQIKAMTRRLQAEKGLGMIIIDYLQLIEPLNPMASPVQQTSDISRALKNLAKELNIPVLVISQLSRAVEQRIPQIPRLADLRQSGSIEQDADIVLFIYREKYYRPDTPKGNIASIIIAKHRNGPCGTVDLYFDEQRVTFKNIETGFEE